MCFRSRHILSIPITLLFLILVSGNASWGQQIVQRGALGQPSQVLDETHQWTVPLLVASDKDVMIYIPDVTNPEWLKRNYSDFENRGVYTLSMFTFYKTPEACRANQTAWGLADGRHLDACNWIGYRVRRAMIDPQQKSVTLIMAGMIDQDGQLDPKSIQDQSVSRSWHQLDANTQAALKKANSLVTEQMKIYDRKLHSAH
jgi:hypothetical protein